MGVDPATEIAARATAQGILTIAEFFSEKIGKNILEQYGQAHLITSHNTCAHVDDLVDLVRGVRNWLHDDGLFVWFGLGRHRAGLCMADGGGEAGADFHVWRISVGWAAAYGHRFEDVGERRVSGGGCG